MRPPRGIGLHGALLLAGLSAGLLGADGSAQVLRQAQIPAQTHVLQQAVTPTAVPATSVVVAASAVWAPTGVTVQRGGRLAMTAQGQWSVGGAPVAAVANIGAFTGPDGIADKTNPRALLPSANIGALIGRIGADGAPFRIGSKYDAAVTADGPLYLAINDEPGAFADNQGRLAVAVTAQAPAPSAAAPVFTPRPLSRLPEVLRPITPTATPTDKPRPGATKPNDVPGRTPAVTRSDTPRAPPAGTPGATRPPATDNTPPSTTRTPPTGAPPPDSKPPVETPPEKPPVIVPPVTEASPAETPPVEAKPPVNAPPAGTPAVSTTEPPPVATPEPTVPPTLPPWVTPVAILVAAALALLLLLQFRPGARREKGGEDARSVTPGGIGSRVVSDGRDGQTLSVKWRGR